MEAVTPIECEIPLLKLAIHILPKNSALEEHLLHLEHLDEQCRDSLTTNEVHKQCIKSQYDYSIKPRILSEGDLVLVYDQDKGPLGSGNFKSMWIRHYIVSKVLKKWAYELVDCDGNKPSEP